jgi:hypothetical protein
VTQVQGGEWNADFHRLSRHTDFFRHPRNRRTNAGPAPIMMMNECAMMLLVNPDVLKADLAAVKGGDLGPMPRIVHSQDSGCSILRHDGPFIASNEFSCRCEVTDTMRTTSDPWMDPRVRPVHFPGMNPARRRADQIRCLAPTGPSCRCSTNVNEDGWEGGCMRAGVVDREPLATTFPKRTQLIIRTFCRKESSSESSSWLGWPGQRACPGGAAARGAS